MPKSFKIGDIIGYGTRPNLCAVFIIKDIDSTRYYLTTIDGKKSVSPVKSIIESPNTTFRKVNKTEVLLYFSRCTDAQFSIFLKICNKLEIAKGLLPPPPFRTMIPFGG